MKFNFVAVQKSLLQQTLEQKNCFPTSECCNFSDIHPYIFRGKRNDQQLFNGWICYFSWRKQNRTVYFSSSETRSLLPWPQPKWPRVSYI